MSTEPAGEEARRRLLIISWAFPPSQVIGAIRVSKFARYLRDHGWDTKVIAGAPHLLPFAPTLREEIPAEDVRHVRFFDPITAVANRRRSSGGSPAGVPAGDASTASAKANLPSLTYRILRGMLRVIPLDNQVRLPDRSLFWCRAALREARAVAQAWVPDAILSSHGPPGPHFVASRLARELGVPWVADYRDPWSGHYGHRYPMLLEHLEERIERAVLRPASHITSVSEQLTRHFASLHHKAASTIYNGFDEEDYPGPVVPDPEFVITFTGVAEAPHRDPEPLFEGVALLRREGVARLPTLRFVGSTNPAYLSALAERHGVRDVVQIERSVPRSQSIALQRRSTVLLAINWGGQDWGGSGKAGSAQTGGMLSGKLMEYLGARRPILVVGPFDPGVSDILARTEAGVWVDSAAGVASVLRVWLAAYAVTGTLASSANEAVLRTFSRQAQTARLAEVLDAVMSSR